MIEHQPCDLGLSSDDPDLRAATAVVQWPEECDIVTCTYVFQAQTEGLFGASYSRAPGCLHGKMRALRSQRVKYLLLRRLQLCAH